MNWYTADVHFSSYKMLPYRPFGDIKEMDEALLDAINGRVRRGDVLYIVGDVMGNREHPYGIIRRIRCDAVLITGNNDEPLLRDKRFRDAFKAVRPSATTVYDAEIGTKVFLSHYPCCSWKDARDGVPHLYGHLHARKDDGYEIARLIPNAVNVGVDVCGFAPVSGKEALRMIREKNAMLDGLQVQLPAWPRAAIDAQPAKPGAAS